MRSPSPRVLINAVDIYPAIIGQDAEGAPTYTYAGAAARRDVPCSVQYLGTGEDVATFGRVTVVNLYDVMFGADPGLAPRTRLIWRGEGRARTLFVQASPPSEAGRGSAWVVRAVENT